MLYCLIFKEHRGKYIIKFLYVNISLLLKEYAGLKRGCGLEKNQTLLHVLSENTKILRNPSKIVSLSSTPLKFLINF